MAAVARMAASGSARRCDLIRERLTVVYPNATGRRPAGSLIVAPKRQLKEKHRK